MPPGETSREIAERIWREQFGEEERREQRAIVRMALEDQAQAKDFGGEEDRADARAPRPRRSAVTGSTLNDRPRAKRRKGSSVPRIGPPKRSD
jgi:hypothetical protein